MDMHVEGWLTWCITSPISDTACSGSPPQCSTFSSDHLQATLQTKFWQLLWKSKIHHWISSVTVEIVTTKWVKPTCCRFRYISEFGTVQIWWTHCSSIAIRVGGSKRHLWSCKKYHPCYRLTLQYNSRQYVLSSQHDENHDCRFFSMWLIIPRGILRMYALSGCASMAADWKYIL